MSRKRILALLPILLAAGCSTAPPKKEEPKQAAAKRTQSPGTYLARLETSKGDIEIQVTRALAPRGADRFYELIADGFYDGTRFYRVLKSFVIQWGINGDPSISQLWANMKILDDPVKAHNTKGSITFAQAGPASRTTQVFINMRDNRPLDKQGFAPFGKVTRGMDVLERLYTYGEMAPRGAGPDPTLIELQGNAYLERSFPRLDYIRKATVQP